MLKPFSVRYLIGDFGWAKGKGPICFLLLDITLTIRFWTLLLTGECPITDRTGS